MNGFPAAIRILVPTIAPAQTIVPDPILALVMTMGVIS